MSPLVFLTALAAGLLPSALLALFSRDRVRGFDGRLRPAPTDIERLLAGFGARFYGKPDPSLARRLEWAQIPIANTPPAWRSLLVLAPLTVGISVFSVMGVAAGNTFGGAVFAGRQGICGCGIGDLGSCVIGARAISARAVCAGAVSAICTGGTIPTISTRAAARNSAVARSPIAATADDAGCCTSRNHRAQAGTSGRGGGANSRECH